MCTLSKDEIDKISVMYEGDKKRDATSKIRGFIFQDYITIMCLLRDKVEYVCSEYLEDVDVFYKNGKFEFIQVKYYPNTSPQREEIFTDLYYQYLRLKMLGSTLDAIPSLYIHRVPEINKPTLQEMKDYLKIKIPKKIDYSTVEDSKKWLRSNIYTISKKKEQKAKFFKTMASEDSLKDFINQFKISSQKNIVEYREELMEKLEKEFPNYVKGSNEDNWPVILLGLAISYIQKRYSLVDPDFASLKFEKKDFTRYMLESSQTKTENIIVSYLVGIASEVYGDIIGDNGLSELQMALLDLIYRNTVCWIEDVANTVDGQYKLLNTFSLEEERKVSEYKTLSMDTRVIKIAECKLSYILFLEYMWKIILNLCQEKILQVEDITINIELLRPDHYIDGRVMEYVCFNFPDDKYVSHCVILPNPGGNFRRITRKIAGRMIKLSQKPEKWFYENNKILMGKNYYSYSQADIIENPTVADLGEDSFYIECMDCIGIDEKEFDSWFVKNGTIENCMDADIHMIQNEKIDEISKVINEDFERLLEMKKNNRKTHSKSIEKSIVKSYD